jgi:phosphatidylglycerol lysyltransferase
MPAQPQLLPHPQSRVHGILSAHGRSALDYFKAAADKSIFFSSTGDSFLAYRVAGSFAIVLGDPVGPEPEIPRIIQAFALACARSGCRFALYQTLPEFLRLYDRLGFKKLKLGADAVVDLKAFTLRGGRARSLRASIHKAERLGVSAHWNAPPLSTALLDELQSVANEWHAFPAVANVTSRSDASTASMCATRRSSPLETPTVGYSHS